MAALGELERSVMELMWERPELHTVREVHLQLHRDLAYTTVMTVLDRLSKKGLLHRERDGRAYRYRPVQARDELVAETMHTALEGDEDDRVAALVAFVNRVSPAEAAAMRHALDRLEGRPDSRPDISYPRS